MPRSVDRDAFAGRWERLHAGFAVQGPLLRGWLRVMWVLARPLAGRVPPDVLTAAGVAAAAGATLAKPAHVPGLVAASAVLDGLDGAVVVTSGRPASAHGRTVDHLADRISDACFAGCLVRAGAPRWVAAAALAASTAQETARERYAGSAAGLVTVGERPVRVIAALVATTAPLAVRRQAATVGAAIWLATSVLATRTIRAAGAR